METEYIVTLETIAKGALSELFQEEQRKILENILDPNTEPEAKRELLLKITYYPNDERDSAQVEIACASKTAPVRKASTVVYIGRRHNEIVAVENNPKQSSLFEESGPRVVAINENKGATE